MKNEGLLKSNRGETAVNIVDPSVSQAPNGILQSSQNDEVNCFAQWPTNSTPIGNPPSSILTADARRAPDTLLWPLSPYTYLCHSSAGQSNWLVLMARYVLTSLALSLLLEPTNPTNRKHVYKGLIASGRLLQLSLHIPSKNAGFGRCGISGSRWCPGLPYYHEHSVRVYRSCTAPISFNKLIGYRHKYYYYSFYILVVWVWL